MSNHFTDPEAHELADAINVVQDRVDAIITQHRVLAERVARLEAHFEYHDEALHILQASVGADEPPDASWRD